MATLTFDDEPIQYLAGIVLRPGNAPAGRGAIGRLRGCSARCGGLPPRRCASGWMAALPDRLLLTFLDRAAVEYVVGLPGNARLDKRVRRLLGRARVLFRTTGQATPVFGETRYAARSWRRKRRVIMKAEVVHTRAAPPSTIRASS